MEPVSSDTMMIKKRFMLTLTAKFRSVRSNYDIVERYLKGLVSQMSVLNKKKSVKKDKIVLDILLVLCIKRIKPHRIRSSLALPQFPIWTPLTDPTRSRVSSRSANDILIAPVLSDRQHKEIARVLPPASHQKPLLQKAEKKVCPVYATTDRNKHNNACM